MEELLTLPRRFTVRWEQNVLLGDHRWRWENMKAMQRFAKALSKELLKFNSKYSNLWNAEVRDRIRLLSTELGQFVTPDTRRLSIRDIEIMVAHGRMACELPNDSMVPGSPVFRYSEMVIGLHPCGRRQVSAPGAKRLQEKAINHRARGDKAEKCCGGDTIE